MELLAGWLTLVEFLESGLVCCGGNDTLVQGAMWTYWDAVLYDCRSSAWTLWAPEIHDEHV